MVLLDTGTPGTSREIYSEDADVHYIFNISQLWLTSHPRSTVILLDTGTPGTSREVYSEDAGVPSRMKSQPQLRNDKYIMMQYINWINSTPSQQ